MTKQSFPIPEGCKAVTVEQVGNQIITTFEPVFKRGNVLICDKIKTLCIFRPTGTNKAYYYFMHDIDKAICNCFSERPYCGFLSDCRHATPEEAQLLWDALAKKGKRWNPETMQVEEIKKKRWRSERGEKYYYINPGLRIGNDHDSEHSVDAFRYEKGNYFQTEEQAQRAANRLQAELDKFWEEELK